MFKIYEKALFGFIIFNFYLPMAHALDNEIDSNFTRLLKSSFVTSVSVGPAWESAGQAQTLKLTPSIIKTYTADRSTHIIPNGELFLGVKNSFSTQLAGQIGVAVVMAGDANLSGDIWDDADPAFNNHTYQYKVSHTAIALKGKLLADWHWPVTPWISAALGIGFNKSYDFDNTPKTYPAMQTPNFSSNTTTALTYTLGVGVERELNDHWQIGAGYEFSDWGRSKLGSAGNSNSGLSLSHLYTNSILFNLTYVA